MHQKVMSLRAGHWPIELKHISHIGHTYNTVAKRVGMACGLQHIKMLALNHTFGLDSLHILHQSAVIAQMIVITGVIDASGHQRQSQWTIPADNRIVFVCTLLAETKYSCRNLNDNEISKVSEKKRKDVNVKQSQSQTKQQLVDGVRSICVLECALPKKSLLSYHLQFRHRCSAKRYYVS